MESILTRKRMGGMRQENACLYAHDENLISDLDAAHYDLSSSQNQAHLSGSRVSAMNNVTVMQEKIHHLEVVAQAKLSALKEELDIKTALSKRAEHQRNQALENAEKLKEAFSDYKARMSSKLKKVTENENKLKERLIEYDTEKQEFEIKCCVMERETEQQRQTISQLKEELRQVKTSAADCSDLQVQLGEATRKALHLERQLVERTANCRELASLRRELSSMRTLTQKQEQKLIQNQREAQQSQAELASLEAILALLHLREGDAGPLCVRPCMLPPVDNVGTAHSLKLKPGEGYQQVLRALQAVETDRTKQIRVVERLQEHLSRAQEEISSLQNSMAQRTSHYQSLHTELLDKVNQATDTEKELKRKNVRVAALEKQLQEKMSAYSQAALKNTELESQLMEKTSTLQHYQSLMNKKQKEYQQSLDKCKKSQAQQNMEQQHKIEMLELSVEEAQSRVLEMEQELNLLQTGRDEAQKTAFLLQSTVEQLAQEKQIEVRHNGELRQSFKEQAAQSAAQMLELQSSLSACEQELNSYLQQMEKEKKNYETELQRSADKVSSLQEKLHSTSVVCQSSSEQNLQLQLSLEKQQMMLSASTFRISELEESQSQLQNKVSGLEQLLERARASLQDELRQNELDVLEKDKSLQDIKKESAQLSMSVSHLTSEMTRCRVELVSKESELQHLRRDVAAKTNQISSMEESLQDIKNLLDSKSELVLDLEEKLHCCEEDRLNGMKRVQVLEEQLQVVRGELSDTLEQLQELRDVLQKTQTIADERQACVDKLTVQLSENQRELEERIHEVLDMDNALKERQGELQQRAQLLGELDVAIKQHKRELERKVESLQKSLEAKEQELRDAQRELGDRNTQESNELVQHLHVCQQKLQTALQESTESRHHCEALMKELDDTNQQKKEKDVKLSCVKEELALKEAHWQQSEARLQDRVSTLEQELELERVQHSKELESLQQTRGQLIKVSEQITSTMRSSQQQCQNQLQEATAQLEQTLAQLSKTKTELEQSQTELLHSKAELEKNMAQYEQSRTQNSQLQAQLEQLTAQLKQTTGQAAQLQAQLQVSKKCMETSSESLLIKDSEIIRLQARISSLERAAERPNLTLSLSALHNITHSPNQSSSAHSTTFSSQKPPPVIHSPPLNHSACLLSPGFLPPNHAYVDPPSPLCGQSSSDSSLDLPPSLKATLKESLSQDPWDSPSASVSPFPDTVDHSWQDLNLAEATSDLSFNPLTYMEDKQNDENLKVGGTHKVEGDDKRMSNSRRESVDTRVGQEDEVDLGPLTGMLRFVNQTLAMQEDPSLWSSTGRSHTGTPQA